MFMVQLPSENLITVFFHFKIKFISDFLSTPADNETS